MLTQGILELTRWFRSLDEATKANIARWALITAAVGAFLALLPTLISLAGAVVGGIVAIGGASAGVVAAVAGVGAALAMLFAYMVGESDNVANNMSDANQTWVDNVLRGVQTVGIALAKFYNWIITQAAKVSDAMAVGLAKVGEWINEVPKGTADALKDEPKITFEGIKINIDKLKSGFES